MVVDTNAMLAFIADWALVVASWGKRAVTSRQPPGPTFPEIGTMTAIATAAPAARRRPRRRPRRQANGRAHAAASIVWSRRRPRTNTPITAHAKPAAFSRPF